MNWTIDSLLGDVANAWSADNWPYTLAFWVAVGLLVIISQRSTNEKRSKNRN